MNYKHILSFILGAACAFAASFFFRQQPKATEIVAEVKPEAKTEYIVRVDTVYIPYSTPAKQQIAESHDIEIEADSTGCKLKIPITQKVYENVANADRLKMRYTAWVSGYRPSLDSLRIEVPAAKPKRWHFGVTAGCAATPHGIEPTIAVGITYSFFSW